MFCGPLLLILLRLRVAIGFVAILCIQGCVEASQVLLASTLLLMGVDHVAPSHPAAMEGQRLCLQAIVKFPNCHEEGCWGHQLFAGKPETSLLDAQPELRLSRLINRSVSPSIFFYFRACRLFLLKI